MSLTTVRLHGILAKQFGAEWQLDVRDIGEVIRAISAQRPGFKEFLISSEEQGFGFSVLVDHQPVDKEEYEYPLGRMKRVDIMPVIRGAGGDFFDALSVVVGVVLIVVGIATGQYWLVGIGAGLALGGISGLLTPTTRVRSFDQDRGEETDDLPSFTFSGARNTIGQGQPIPVGYGRLRVGSHMISFGIDNVLTVEGS